MIAAGQQGRDTDLKLHRGFSMRSSEVAIPEGWAVPTAGVASMIALASGAPTNRCSSSVSAKTAGVDPIVLFAPYVTSAPLRGSLEPPIESRGSAEPLLPTPLKKTRSLALRPLWRQARQ